MGLKMETLENFFDFRKRNTNLKIEVIAGITTFLTMAYISVVNPDILKNAGMDQNALIVITCLTAGLATLATGLIANAPIAMAPGMGMNAFFAFTLVLTNQVSWQTALGIVFISGLFFFIISILGIREKIVEAIPNSHPAGISVGIGLFITFIGMKNMNLVVASQPTLVKLGNIKDPTVLIGIAGLVVIIVLEILKVRGSILIGIAVATVLGIATGHVQPPTALINLNLDISSVFLKLDILSALKFGFIGPIFTLMFLDMFDSVGTLVGCCYEAKMVDDEGNIQKLGTLLTLDAGATMTGALFGTSTTTSYIESASGIEAGGRTGLTSVVTGLLFLLTMIFAPLIAVVPSYATAPALIIVGLFMMKHISHIDFSEIETAFPAFITIVMMPLTYSISTGLACGFIFYTLIKILRGKIAEVGAVMWVVTALSILSLIL